MLAASLVLFGCLGLLSVQTGTTTAAWTDSERTRGTFTAAIVNPPQSLSCTGSQNGSVTFKWTNPTGGATRTGYTWTITGLGAGSGTELATATSRSVSLQTLLNGTGTFTLRAKGPTGTTWQSTAASVSFTTSNGGSTVTC